MIVCAKCTVYSVNTLYSVEYVVLGAKYEQKIIILVLIFNSPYVVIDSRKCVCVKENYCINISTLIITIQGLIQAVFDTSIPIMGIHILGKCAQI